MARAGCWSLGLLRRPGSQQGRQNGNQRSSVPSLIESKRHHHRRRNAAVLRAPKARIRILARIPATTRPWRPRSGAPAPCGLVGLSIQASSAPITPPCAELRAGWPAPPQESTIPSLFILEGNSGSISHLFRSRFGKKEVDEVPGAPFSAKRGPCTICYLLFPSR